MSQTATATMTVVLEIEASGSWGEECTIGQVNKQARESALGLLNNLLSVPNQRSRFKLVSTSMGAISIRENK